MKCPHCGAEGNHVVETKSVEKFLRRRRECYKCGKRWTTYEVSINPKVRVTSCWLVDALKNFKTIV